MSNFPINADIKKAKTLPGNFYRDESVFEKIFSKSWHWVAENAEIQEPFSVFPFTLLPGILDEPLLFTNDANGVKHCISNVCTHRANLLVNAPGKMRLISCGYHGRCFRLDGSFRSMPKFELAENFPSPDDDLPKIAFAEWLNLLFVSLDPSQEFQKMIKPMAERVGWLPLETLEFSPENSKDYYVDAHWALYVDNYLEGFHIPFVHPALNQAIEFDDYEYELYEHGNLQIGVAKTGEPHFEVPPGHPDFGKKIYAWYFWLFPNLMFNFYPWGLSLNVVEPLGIARTRVRFRSYFFRGTGFDRERNALDITELEDERVVESAQRGVRSRFYKAGRFSPEMERGVHHFHKMLSLKMSS